MGDKWEFLGTQHRQSGTTSIFTGFFGGIHSELFPPTHDHSPRAPVGKAILQNLQLATQLDPQSYKAWHAWALFNQKVGAPSIKGGGLRMKKRAHGIAALVSGRIQLRDTGGPAPGGLGPVQCHPFYPV